MTRLQLSIIQAQTVSASISHTRNGVAVDLSTCIVSYLIMEKDSKDLIEPEVYLDNPEILLIPSTVTKELNGDYLIRVYINNSGFVDVIGIDLSVEK